jgi:hypothetical protein
MKHSFAYVFCMRPGPRSHDGRNGVVAIPIRATPQRRYEDRDR